MRRNQKASNKSTQSGTYQKKELRQIPLMQIEVKKLLRSKQDNDEAEAIKHLAEAEGIQSVASRIYQTWKLDRHRIRDCHIAMNKDRQLQVTFNNIIAATSFKTVEGTQLVRAQCQRRGCGAVDSWEHFLQCYEVQDISNLRGKEKINALAEICRKAAEPNPVRPKPTTVRYNGGQTEEPGPERGQERAVGTGGT